MAPNFGAPTAPTLLPYRYWSTRVPRTKDTNLIDLICIAAVLVSGTSVCGLNQVETIVSK